MELRDAMRTTAAVRSFTDEPVAPEVLHAILDDARFAPSGGNQQGWRVAVVDDRALRRQLADLSAPVTAQPSAPPPSSRPIIESSAPPTEAEIIASGKGKFAWPVRGEILSSFGASGPGQRNDGLDIRSPQGTPVLSAADGEVAYAGNQVPQFGNLVLVKHAGGYTTAYAHADRLTVSRGDFVAKGQVIGYAGQTGDVTTPQLHFEIRSNTTPVNPRSYLASTTASN